MAYSLCKIAVNKDISLHYLSTAKKYATDTDR